MLAYNGSVPGPVPEGAGGLGASSSTSRTRAISRRRCIGMGCGWRTVTTARTRRRRRSRSGGGSRTASSSRIRARTGTTRTSGRTTARRWASTGPSSSIPADPDYWAPAHREVMVTLDDVLIEDGRIAPFDPRQATYAAMGRFGNQMLVNGEPELRMSARRGEVVRFYLTNTANTRVFNFAISDARMKLVGGDSGRCEHEELVDSVIVSPSERAVVDVLFETPGPAALEHRTPERRLRPRRRGRDRRAGRARARSGFREPAHQPGDGGRARADRAVPRRPAGQDGRAGGGDRLRGAGGGDRVLLPDASRGRQRRAGQVPEVRDEADAARRGGDLHVPDASRGRQSTSRASARRAR